MADANLRALNDQFAIPGHVSFRAGPGGLTVAQILNDHASASVALLGGHVLAFQPHGHEPVLWLSKFSRFQVGEPIRGGVPICWPWFSSHPEDRSKPFHGFARTAVWTVTSTSAVEGDATRVVLGLEDDERTRALWPHAFRLEIATIVGPQLRLELAVHNTGDEAWTYTGALHTYLTVGDVTAIAIHGLDGCRYLEKSPQPQLQRGPITIHSEVDRVYLDTTAECVVEDPVMRRRIRIAKEGSRNTVVWNPWAERAKTWEDFGDQEYTGMVCVETANARQSPMSVPAHGKHALCAAMSVERM
jgi:D-hexose-6-phosphate mutarotase